ncbi:Fic family protein [Janthinobacterium sp. Mn2066]|uniref:Fic family protein n=1 Tax=Janthinobacterium sp. Mn2066 TaxID=3395264 RepID=UPI003BC125D6
MYSEIHQFEPTLPSDRLWTELYPIAEKIVIDSTRLTEKAHATTRSVIRELVRQMNSYYSNRIEGQSTHPLNIADALKRHFSHRPDEARLQRIALAHIGAEQALEQALGDHSPLSSGFLIGAHREMYQRLAPEDRLSDDGLEIMPGQLRNKEVKVGEHVAPTAESIPRFLSRMNQQYEPIRGETQTLIIAACAHHRGAWVHPFLDGNGRALRLQSHCALWKLSEGLWSPSRGFARDTSKYYEALNAADRMREGDYDGRGNLSQQGFSTWILYFLSICQDQVSYMSKMLDLDGVRKRIEALIIMRSLNNKDYRTEAILPLMHVFALGPVTRGDFSQMTGLGERTARTLIAKLLEDGLLLSDHRVGPVRMGLPLDALNVLFPALYPEVNQPLI